MLNLKRKPNESITLSGGIVFHVLSIGSDAVRIGIDAPDAVRIWRTELLANEKQTNENQAKHSTN